VRTVFDPPTDADALIDSQPYDGYLRMPLCAKPDPDTGGYAAGVYWVRSVWHSAGDRADTASFDAATLYEMSTVLPLPGQTRTVIPRLDAFVRDIARRDSARRSEQTRRDAAVGVKRQRLGSSGPTVSVAVVAAFPSDEFCRAAVIALLDAAGPHEQNEGSLRVTARPDGAVTVRPRRPVHCPIADRTHSKADTTVFRISNCGRRLAQRCFHGECCALPTLCQEQRAPWHVIEVHRA
jgi:hypothetical protein